MCERGARVYCSSLIGHRCGLVLAGDAAHAGVVLLELCCACDLDSGCCSAPDLWPGRQFWAGRCSRAHRGKLSVSTCSGLQLRLA